MTRPLLFLIEDSEDDIALMQLALREGRLPCDVLVLPDGEAAQRRILAIDRAVGKAGEPAPSLVLLDLKLPVIDGHELLKVIRASQWGQYVPVVVLTTSHLPDDIDRAYEAGANAFVQKPMEFSALVELVDVTTRFWLSYNKLHRSVR